MSGEEETRAVTANGTGNLYCPGVSQSYQLRYPLQAGKVTPLAPPSIPKFLVESCLNLMCPTLIPRTLERLVMVRSG